MIAVGPHLYKNTPAKSRLTTRRQGRRWAFFPCLLFSFSICRSMSDIHTVLRAACRLGCNPAGLQQALVHGGRNSDKYQERRVEHKSVCCGCSGA